MNRIVNRERKIRIVSLKLICLSVNETSLVRIPVGVADLVRSRREYTGRPVEFGSRRPDKILRVLWEQFLDRIRL